MRKRFPGEMTVLGGFEMTSQTMRVSDPCYDRDVWCCGTFGKCKTGTWEAGVLKTDMGDWGVRCAVLAVRHKETGPDYSVIRQRKVYQMKDGWLEQPIDVGVDSGQAGFYDEAFYQDNSIFKGMPEPEHDYGDLWYNHACDITLSEMSAGVMPYGVVSSSGFGDGSYVCYTHKGSDGEIDFAFVIFMDQYMISSFAAIDRNGDWLGSGDMGWFGISTNDKEERAWNDELQTLLNEAQDDDFLVVVDCHI